MSAPVSTMTRRKVFHRGRRPGLVTRTSTANTPIPSPLYEHSPQAPGRCYRIGVLNEAWAANRPTVEVLTIGLRLVMRWRRRVVDEIRPPGYRVHMMYIRGA